MNYSIAEHAIFEPGSEVPPSSQLISSQPAASQTNSPAPSPQLCRFSDLLDAWSEDATAAFEARVNKIPRGPITGFTKLDKSLNGALAPGLHIAHGQPGAGKSAFALQIAAACGCAALYVTCEMAPLELLRRHTARVTGTYLGRLKSGELHPSDSLELARRAVREAPLLAFIDATQSYASPVFIRDCALIAKGESRHLLIIVDSLHSWAEGAAAGSTEYETLNAGISALRALAHQLGCPILAVSERNRDSMKNGGLSAGAGTRKIEYGAETVLQLHRDPAEREDSVGEMRVEVSLEKNRHGTIGKVTDFMFHGALQRFRQV